MPTAPVTQISYVDKKKTRNTDFDGNVKQTRGTRSKRICFPMTSLWEIKNLGGLNSNTCNSDLIFLVPSGEREREEKHI